MSKPLTGSLYHHLEFGRTQAPPARVRINNGDQSVSKNASPSLAKHLTTITLTAKCVTLVPSKATEKPSVATDVHIHDADYARLGKGGVVMVLWLEVFGIDVV